jgi:Zn finger protein HypA/HybF involved in hydrogenase expression
MTDVALYHRRYADKLQSALATYKLESGCVDCGYAIDPDALQFDHRELVRSKTRKLGHTTSGINQIVLELDRVDVRCANCHSIRTRAQQRGGW